MYDKSLVYDKLATFYGYEIPEYIKSVGKTYVTILVSDWQGTQRLKITLKDVVTYYATQASNISSGIRGIAGYSGDWRSIDALASECLAWFKVINIEMLRKESVKQGLVPTF